MKKLSEKEIAHFAELLADNISKEQCSVFLGKIEINSNAIDNSNNIVVYYMNILKYLRARNKVYALIEVLELDGCTFIPSFYNNGDKKMSLLKGVFQQINLASLAMGCSPEALISSTREQYSLGKNKIPININNPEIDPNTLKKIEARAKEIDSLAEESE